MTAETAGQSAAFRIAVMPERERVVVVPQGELDIATAGAVEQEVEQLVARGFASVVLDLRELAFIDSSGLRLLLRLDAAARAEGFAFAIRECDGPVRRLLELTRLNTRFATERR
jgi:anti-anti-sigma factor